LCDETKTETSTDEVQERVIHPVLEAKRETGRAARIRMRAACRRDEWALVEAGDAVLIDVRTAE
jgi:hypothetical protein